MSQNYSFQHPTRQCRNVTKLESGVTSVQHGNHSSKWREGATRHLSSGLSTSHFQPHLGLRPFEPSLSPTAESTLLSEAPRHPPLLQARQTPLQPKLHRSPQPANSPSGQREGNGRKLRFSEELQSSALPMGLPPECSCSRHR